jgi:cell division protein FtsA
MDQYISIDIGTKNIKIILVTKSPDNNSFKIVSKKSYPSFGVSFGYINNSSLFLESFKRAINLFEKENRIRVDEAFFSLNGFGVRGENKSIAHQTADGLITEFDLEDIEKKAISELKKKNSDEIIEKINIKTTIDSFEHFSNPVDLQAKKFESEFLFITQSKNNIIIFEDVLSSLDISPLGFFPSLISSGEFSLSELDKKLGCALVDIGEETTSIIIYDNNKPVYYNVLKNGSKQITEKISILEKVDFQKAEELKEGKIISRKIEQIFIQEAGEIAEKILREIKLSGRENILPGGITIVGGGSKLANIEKVLKEKLVIPVKKPLTFLQDIQTDYHSAYGNIVLGIKKDYKQSIKIKGLLNYAKKFLRKFSL